MSNGHDLYHILSVAAVIVVVLFSVIVVVAETRANKKENHSEK